MNAGGSVNVNDAENVNVNGGNANVNGGGNANGGGSVNGGGSANANEHDGRDQSGLGNAPEADPAPQNSFPAHLHHGSS